MNHFALLRVVADEEASAPLYAFGERSEGHLIFRPQKADRCLQLVESKGAAACQNP